MHNNFNLYQHLRVDELLLLEQATLEIARDYKPFGVKLLSACSKFVNCELFSCKIKASASLGTQNENPLDGR